MTKYHQGKYKLKFPEKYEGDITNVVYRSSWELKFLIWCENTSNVIKFSSEELVIPYRCGTDNQIHRYFIDFKLKIRQRDDSIKIYIVEIKPMAQTMAPKYPGKRTKRYITEAMIFVKNQSKWKAASEYAKDRNWIFKIITEKDLF